MGYLRIWLWSASFVVTLLPNSSQAQASEGEIVASAGLGYNLNYNVFVPNGGYLGIYGIREFYPSHIYKPGPVLNASFDFAPVDVLSLGIGYSSMNVSSKYKLSYRYNIQSVSHDTTYNIPIEEELTVTNFGIRIFAHVLPDNRKIDLYFGGRIGMNLWNYRYDPENLTTTNFYDNYSGSNTTYDEIVTAQEGMSLYDHLDSDNYGIIYGYETLDGLLLKKNSVMTPTIQGGFGITYYIIRWVGLNFETMVGTGPYLFRLGANLRLGAGNSEVDYDY
jgi:hypothetical protein